jgi:nucleoside-diphosphate-sugar epimerase
MNRQVLILGAAGRLGRVLTLAFANAGWRTQAVCRRDVPAEFRGHAGIEVLALDALDTTGLMDRAAGASVVINALNAPYHRWDALALPLSRAAQTVAATLGALLMLPGNVYNFGNELPARLRPDTLEVGNTPKGALRILMEEELRQAGALDSVVIRAGDFFGGTGRGSWFDQAIVSRLKGGTVVYPGPVFLPHAWAYLPDLAQAFVAVAERRERLTGHQRLHFAGHTVTGEQLAAALSRVQGRQLQLSALPWWLFKLAAPFVPSWRAVLEMRYLWSRPHQLDGKALAALVGPLPGTPLDAALAQSVVDLGLQASLPMLRQPSLKT